MLIWFFFNLVALMAVPATTETSFLWLFYVLMLSLLMKLFVSNKHLLIVLLIMEFLAIVMSMMVLSSLTSSMTPLIFFMVVFTMMVCEATTGLTLMVNFVREKSTSVMTV